MTFDIFILLVAIGVLASGLILTWPIKPKAAKKAAATAELPGTGISLLVPYRSDNARRAETWTWLRQYWRCALPGAQIVIGTDNHVPFCKTAAVNQAFRKAENDVVVILDADCYIDPAVILDCAERIRLARRVWRQPLWFVPYRRFYRLTEEASNRVLESSPAHPYRFPSPPSPEDLTTLRGTSNGHWYGALIQIMPAEAFIAAGGMPETFSGWGGEDVAFMRAVDTLYVKHKTTDNDVLHLWHPVIPGKDEDTRMWPGQERPDANWPLAEKYERAFGDRAAMAKLTGTYSGGNPGTQLAYLGKHRKTGRAWWPFSGQAYQRGATVTPWKRGSDLLETDLPVRPAEPPPDPPLPSGLTSVN